MTIDVKYQEVKMADVLSYFAEGFTFEDGGTLNSYEAFIDPIKGVVVFKLIIEKPSPRRKETP